tara:strand:+ start:98 stop:490 length:393 start_codon:yes stop_codon:yes gene_type:complete
MATTPQFVNTPRIETVNVATANTAINGSGTITALIQGATGGTRVLEVVVKGAATTAAANINIFLTTDSGTTWRLFDTISVTAVTTADTTPTNRVRTTYPNLVLKDATHRVGVTTTISQSTNVIALGGDLT